VDDRGTIVASSLFFLETTTTSLFFTISGGLNPVLKSHINTCPGFGWNVIGMTRRPKCKEYSGGCFVARRMECT